MKKTQILLLLILTSCASKPESIQTAYISPLQYRDYNCDQLASEGQRVSRRASELHGSLDTKAGNDQVQMGVGLLLFWPALFLLEGGDGPEAQEYSRLKGEREAIEKVSIEKNCRIKFQDAPATAPDRGLAGGKKDT